MDTLKDGKTVGLNPEPMGKSAESLIYFTIVLGGACNTEDTKKPEVPGAVVVTAGKVVNIDVPREGPVRQRNGLPFVRTRRMVLLQKGLNLRDRVKLVTWLNR